jgi:NAD(P)-dependent dehydrogenase (short-subunit alcohol dehydrogenase family)
VDLELQGRCALVTGGSRGIGRASARQLAREGCDIAIAARNGTELKEAAGEISAETGRRVVAVVADTADDASVADMVSQATAELGHLDILVNAAARSAGASGPATTISAGKLLDEIDVKALGYLRCAQAVAPQMIERRWGRIVNVGGLAARQTGSVSAAMRNVAVAALTKNLADELGAHGINVTAVHPGTTRTERVDARLRRRAQDAGIEIAAAAAEAGSAYAIGRIVEPDEIAYLIAFLASPRSVAVNGDAIPCGGGRIGSIHY